MIYLTPGKAGHIIPTSTGRPASARSVIRRIVRGELRAVRGLNGWLTTEAWVQEFLAEQTAVRLRKRPAATIEQRAQRARALLMAKGWVSGDATKSTA